MRIYVPTNCRCFYKKILAVENLNISFPLLQIISHAQVKGSERFDILQTVSRTPYNAVPPLI